MIDLAAMSEEFAKVEAKIKAEKETAARKHTEDMGRKFREAIEAKDDYAIGLMLGSFAHKPIFFR